MRIIGIIAAALLASVSTARAVCPTAASDCPPISASQLNLGGAIVNPQGVPLIPPNALPTAGQVLTATDNAGHTSWQDGGTDSVTSISVAPANGLSGSVANATTTPVITLSTTVAGMVKGNGTGFSAATPGTDYLAPNSNGSSLSGLTWGQIGSTPTTLGGYGITDGLRTENNLADLSSKSAARANTLPVTYRPPLPTDNAGFFTAGQSFWREPDGQIDQLYEIAPDGTALWQPYSGVGSNPASVVGGAVFCGGTRRIASGYTGNLFVVTRESDLTTQVVAQLPDGSPDMSTLAGFLSPVGGFGLVTTVYNQCVAGHDATQTVLANAPTLDMATAHGTNIPILIASTKASYWLSVYSYPSAAALTFTWSSGTTITSTATLPQWVMPGDLVAGTNIPNTVGTGSISGTAFTAATGTYAVGMTLTGPAVLENTVITGGTSPNWTVNNSQTTTTGAVTGSTTISSINYATGAMVLSVAPTAAPANVTFSAWGQWLDLPSTVQVPFQTWSWAMSTRMAAQGAATGRPIIVGLHGNDGTLNTANWSSIENQGISGLPYGMRLIQGDNLGTAAAVANVAQDTQPQVVGTSFGSGSNGRSMVYQWAGQQGTDINYTAQPPSATLSGGAIGYNQQYTSTTDSGDYGLYGLILWPSAISLQNFNDVTAAWTANQGMTPQVSQSLVMSGSSTTAGNGTTTIESWPSYVADYLGSISPALSYNEAFGGPIEQSTTDFGNGEGNVPTAQRGLLIFFPGIGNSIQAALTATVTGQANNGGGGTTFTISGSTANGDFLDIGVSLSGTPGACLPAGATLLSSTTNTVTTDVQHTASGTCTSINVINDTATTAWTALTNYCAVEQAAGYRLVLVGSGVRGGFTGSVASGQLADFASFKIYSATPAALSAACPNAIGYVDLENYKEWGNDGGMTVTAVNAGAQQVTVAALSGATFTGLATGTTLETNSGLTGVVRPGMHVYVAGVDTGVTIAAYGTGSGGLGTYTLSGTLNESNGTVFTVSTAGVGDRIYWSGMPYNIGADTGAQAVAAVSGTTITLSGATTGLSVGSTVYTMNPIPWVAFPSIWSGDKQHYQPGGYRLIARIIANYITSNEMLQ